MEKTKEIKDILEYVEAFLSHVSDDYPVTALREHMKEKVTKTIASLKNCIIVEVPEPYHTAGPCRVDCPFMRYSRRETVKEWNCNLLMDRWELGPNGYDHFPSPGCPRFKEVKK